MLGNFKIIKLIFLRFLPESGAENTENPAIKLPITPFKHTAMRINLCAASS